MLNSEKSQKIFLFFFYPTTLAVSGQFQQFQGSFTEQFQNRNSFKKSFLEKVFLENYFIFIYQSRTSIHSSSPLTTLA